MSIEEAAPTGGETAVSEGGSVSTTVSTATETNTLPPENQAFLDQLPESHREKGWAKNYKDMDGFVKSYEDTKSALSKRPAGIPDANASDEDKQAFNKARGVPESFEGYEMEAYPEGYEPTEVDKAWKSDSQKMFHKANLDPAQAKILETEFNAVTNKFMEAQAAAKGQADSEFNALTQELYGDKADAVLASNKALILKHSDPRFHSHIGNMDNQALMALSTAIDGIKKEYIGEDTIPQGDQNVSTGVQTNAEIQDAMAKVMMSEAFQNPNHQGHAKAVEAKNSLVSSLKF